MAEIIEATKDVEQVVEESIQPRARGAQPMGFVGLLNYLVQGGSYRVAPWWSPKRDEDLSAFWKSSDALSGTIAMLTSKVVTIPVRALPRDTALTRHQREAEEFTIRLNEYSEYGEGFTVALSKWLEDWFGSDNGAYMEIIGGGDKDGPIEGPAEGVAHIDSARCTRTGDPEYPVTYHSPDSGVYKLHRTRVAFGADQPSAREEMLGVGYCSVSRTLSHAQNLMDISTYKQEKLGSRPLRAMLIAKGVSGESITNALAIAAETMDSRNLQIFSQIALLADLDVDATIELLDLTSLPDGFDEETSTRLGMFAIALGFGVPIRWIYPASTSGATKADAMYQHIAGLGGGIGRILKTLTMLLGGDPRGQRHAAGKFLPPHLKLVFDFQDDEQDRNQADIKDKRATTRNANLETSVIDVRVAREQALMNDDLTQAQFDYLEREDGRLPGGAPILSLFHTTKKPYFEWLDLGVPNPLAVSANDAVDMLSEINRAAVEIQDVLANSTRAVVRTQAMESLSALDQLKAMYAPLAQQAIQQEVMQRFRSPLAPTPGGEEEAPTLEPSEEGTEEEVKGFDYGVSVGEVITGELARGAGGQFINKEELMAQIRAGMIERMQSAGGTNSAGDARASNRAEMAEKLGLSPELLEALAGMKTGETSLEMEQQLAEMGLAKENPDGSISMTGAGRSLLAAVNSGDVDKAEQALANAKAPKAGKPGKKPPGAKPDEGVEKGPEQVRTDNRAEVADAISDRIDPDDFEGLVDFGKGLDLDVDRTRRLAQAGLIEVGATGEATLSRAGSALLSAADRGDVRGAKDILAQARERVVDTLARAEQARQEADHVMDSVQELAQKNTERLNQVMADTQRTLERNELRAQQAMARAERRAEDKEQKATKLDAKADGLEQEATGVDAKANEIDAKIDKLTAELELATGDMADFLSRKIETLRGQSDSTRGRANEVRERARLARQDADDAREDADGILKEGQLRVSDLAQDSRDAVEKANQRAAELQDQVDTAAEKAQARQEQLRIFAKQLEDSVGGGVAPEPGPELEPGAAPEPTTGEVPTTEPAQPFEVATSAQARVADTHGEGAARQIHSLLTGHGMGNLWEGDNLEEVSQRITSMAALGTPEATMAEVIRREFGERKSLGQRVLDLFRSNDVKQKVEPEGEPLEPWPEDMIVPITRGDIETANRQWDENPALPDRAAGILEARQAGREEVADAIGKGH